MKVFSIKYLVLGGLLAASLYTAYCILYTPTVYSQSPTITPKASVSPSPSSTPTANGKSIRDNLRERVEERLTQLINKPRAFVGKLTQISSSALTLETKNGVKQVKVTEETTIIQVDDKGKQKTIKEADLVVGNFLVAMGFAENKDTLEARRVLTMSQDPLEIRKPVYGAVESVTSGTFVVKHPKKAETWTVKTSTKTGVTKKVDGKMEKAKVSDIAVEDRIIAVGATVKNGANTIQAELIHVIPGKAHGLSKSPTASPKATKSPSPKPNPSP